MIVSMCLIYDIKWQKPHMEHKEVKFCEKKILHTFMINRSVT